MKISILLVLLYLLVDFAQSKEASAKLNLQEQSNVILKKTSPEEVHELKFTMNF